MLHATVLHATLHNAPIDLSVTEQQPHNSNRMLCTSVCNFDTSKVSCYVPQSWEFGTNIMQSFTRVLSLQNSLPQCSASSALIMRAKFAKFQHHSAESPIQLYGKLGVAYGCHAGVSASLHGGDPLRVCASNAGGASC